MSGVRVNSLGLVRQLSGQLGITGACTFQSEVKVIFMVVVGFC